MLETPPDKTYVIWYFKKYMLTDIHLKKLPFGWGDCSILGTVLSSSSSSSSSYICRNLKHSALIRRKLEKLLKYRNIRKLFSSDLQLALSVFHLPSRIISSKGPSEYTLLRDRRRWCLNNILLLSHLFLVFITV